MNAKARLGSLFLLTCLAVFAAAPANDRAAKLEALKKEFPTHLVGRVDENTDPIIRKSYLSYKNAVERLTLKNLPEELGRLRERLNSDIDDPGNGRTAQT